MEDKKEAPAAKEEPKQNPRITELKVSFGALTEKNREVLNVINKLCLPVVYSSEFYLSLALSPDKYCRLAYYKDIPIGGISCKVEEYKGEKSMYIMTIGVLPKYRRYRVASQMLEHSIKDCAKAGGAASVYLHVQTSNELAIKFYKNSGFDIVETLENYYTENIDPPHAHVMYKKI